MYIFKKKILHIQYLLYVFVPEFWQLRQSYFRQLELKTGSAQANHADKTENLNKYNIPQKIRQKLSFLPLFMENNNDKLFKQERSITDDFK